VGHREVGEWRTDGISHRDLTARSSQISMLGFAISQSLKSEVPRDKGPLKSQLTCTSEFWCIGYRKLENQVLDIVSGEVTIGEG
jgi:hypothetical protein